MYLGIVYLGILNDIYLMYNHTHRYRESRTRGNFFHPDEGEASKIMDFEDFRGHGQTYLENVFVKVEVEESLEAFFKNGCPPYSSWICF